MNWFHTHPYATSIALFVAVFIVGTFIVANRSTVAPNSSTTTAWGGGGGFFYSNFEGTANNSAENAPDLYKLVQDSPPFLYIPPSPYGMSDSEDSVNGFDFDALLAQLSSKDETQTEASSGDSLFIEAYSYIPQTFIATSSIKKERTEIQEALYNYGNEAGSYIQLFEDRNKDMALVLQDQINDPENPEKIAALAKLADSIANVGRSLETIENVPAQVASVNARLAKNYQDMGSSLVLVPDASTETEQVDAMLAYNATAESFVKSYVSLVTLFSITGVTFAPGDPGSVFTFTAPSF